MSSEVLTIFGYLVQAIFADFDRGREWDLSGIGNNNILLWNVSGTSWGALDLAHDVEAFQDLAENNLKQSN